MKDVIYKIKIDAGHGINLIKYNLFMDKKRIYYIYKIIFLCGSLKDHYYIGKRCSILPKYLAIKEDIQKNGIL